MTVVAVTGHRPDKLGGYDRAARVKLTQFARRHVTAKRPTKIITGMALGWDQAVALACALDGIPFLAAIPFEGQERLWSADAQRRYRDLLDRAAEVHVITEHQSAHSFILRNRWMVDRCDELDALWNGTPGGTAHCVNYAIQKKVDWDNLWQDWEIES